MFNFFNPIRNLLYSTLISVPSFRSRGGEREDRSFLSRRFFVPLFFGYALFI